jgi:mRNA-degrading endonuclease toxin of MazEF toxin-antitoxin module
MKPKKIPKINEAPPGPLLRGQVLWAREIPNQPNDPHIPRPVIIVSTNSRNKFFDSVIVVPLSHGLSNPHKTLHVHIPKGQGGVPKDGFARCELVSTIDKDFLDLRKGPIGIPLADKYMFAISRGIRLAVGEVI